MRFGSSVMLAIMTAHTSLAAPTRNVDFEVRSPLPQDHGYDVPVEQHTPQDRGFDVPVEQRVPQDRANDVEAAKPWPW